MNTAGVESKWHEPTPVSRFVAPGPLVASATPGTPVMRAAPSAAKAAPCSWCMLTRRGPPRTWSESTMWAIVPPTTSKTCSTPCAASTSAMWSDAFTKGSAA